MFAQNGMSKHRPQMRRAKSHYSIRAKFVEDEESASDDSVSDISMDSCFHRPQRSDDEDMTDESDEELVQKNRSFRNSDLSLSKKLIVMTPSSRKKPGIGKMMSKRGKMALTTEDIDTDKGSDLLRFDSSKFLTAGSRVKQQQRQPTKMQRKSSLLVDSSEESSISAPKAKEFEDVVDQCLSASQRQLEFGVTQDPFLSGDDDGGPQAKKRRKKKKKKREKGSGIDWDEVDAKGKASLSAYAVAEGNIYPEITNQEAKKFKRSGNAWLEGRYSKNADWKRNATGMVLAVPSPLSPKQRKSLVRPEGLVTDRIPKDKSKTPSRGGRTEITIAEVPPPAPASVPPPVPAPPPPPQKAIPEEKEEVGRKPLPESSGPSPTVSKPSDRRSKFLRANSMPTFKLPIHFFKRSSATSKNSNPDDSGLLLDEAPEGTSCYHELLPDESMNTSTNVSATGTAESMDTPNSENRGTSADEVNDEKSSNNKSNSKKDRSSKKNGKTKVKESSELSKRSKCTATGNEIKTESHEPTSTTKRAKKQSQGMEVIGEYAEHIKHKKPEEIGNAIRTEAPEADLRRIKSLEPTKSKTKLEGGGEPSTTRGEAGHGKDFFIIEFPARKMRSVSTELAESHEALSSTRQRAKSLDTDDIDDLPGAPTRRKSSRSLSRQSASRESHDSRDRSPVDKSNHRRSSESRNSHVQDQQDYCMSPPNNLSTKKAISSSRRRSNESPSKDGQDGQDLYASPSNNFGTKKTTKLERKRSTKEQKKHVQDEQEYFASPSNDFVGTLKGPKHNERPSYSGSSDDASKSSYHRHSSGSVSSDDGTEPSKRKSKTRRSAGRSTATSRRSSGGHSSDDLDKGKGGSSTKIGHTRNRRRIHSLDASEEGTGTSSARTSRSIRKSNSSEALEKILSMSAKLHASTSTIEFSDDHDGAVNESRKSRKKQRKKDKQALEEMLSMSAKLNASTGTLDLSDHDGAVNESRKSEKKQRKKDKPRASILKVMTDGSEASVGDSKPREGRAEAPKRERGSTHRRRRSTSIPKRVDEVEARARETSSHDRGSTHRRRRGSSVPRAAEKAVSEATPESVETSNHDRGKTHRRRRGSSVPRAAEKAASEATAENVSKSREGLSSPNTSQPRRRRSVEGRINSSYEPSAGQLRHRRSLNIGREQVASSHGSDDVAPPTPVHERNESHQNVGFSGSRTSDDTAPPPTTAQSKQSFLSRFAKLEHEKISKPDIARRAAMQRAQSERSFKTPSRVKSCTPTSKALPTKQVTTAAGGSYSDMAMQGKIGRTETNC